MAPETAGVLDSLPKGDALLTAQIAGVMAAKRTSELIPLCHPLPLTQVDVRLGVDGTADAVAAELPDAAIVATGATEYAPSVPNDGSVPV